MMDTWADTPPTWHDRIVYVAKHVGSLACMRGNPATAREWLHAAAWPDPADPPFTNAVVQVKTPLPPAALLAFLHDVEAAFGRTRTAPNAPRTLGQLPEQPQISVQVDVNVRRMADTDFEITLGVDIEANTLLDQSDLDCGAGHRRSRASQRPGRSERPGR